MSGRHYSEDQKVAAVIAAEMTTNLQVERATGIPNQTISRWRDDPKMRIYVDKTREQRASDTAVLVGLVTDKLIEMVLTGQLPPKELVVLFGVGNDKLQLLLGEATSRTETRDITGTISDVELSAAIREAESLAGSGRAPQEVETEAEG